MVDWNNAIESYTDVIVEYATSQNRYRLEWVYLGEGYDLDYDPDDPSDEPLLRFDVYVWNKDAGDWDGHIDDASYCTMNNVKTSADDLIMMGHSILMDFADAWDAGSSGKRTLERWSWVTPIDFVN